jgi:hypothetical protein
MKKTPTGPFHPIGVLALRSLVVCGTVALTPLAAQSQINETEGLWQGTLSCGPQLSAAARSPQPFSNPLSVVVSLAALSGKRDNPQVTERFGGSIERSGRVNLEGSGHWKDNPARAWRYRLQGTQSGSRMALAGPMESPDGQTRIRDCKVELANPAMERRSRVANTKPAPVVVSPVPAAPVAPVGRAPEKVNKDKELAERQAADQAAADQRAAAAKRQAEDAAAAKASAAELEALRLKNQQLEAARQAAERASEKAAEKAAADKAAAETRKAPIRARSAMDL